MYTSLIHKTIKTGNETNTANNMHLQFYTKPLKTLKPGNKTMPKTSQGMKYMYDIHNLIIEKRLSHCNSNQQLCFKKIFIN